MSSYPPNPRSGIPTTLTVTSQNVTLARGNTLQLSPVLTDANGNGVTPVLPFTFSSSNPALVSVNVDGLCTAAPSNPSVLQTGGLAEIEISFPWAGGISEANICTSVQITVTVPAGISISLGNCSKIYPAS